MIRMKFALATVLGLLSPLAMAAVSDADFQALKDTVTALSQKLADVERELADERARSAQAAAAGATAVAAPAATPAAPAAAPAPSWTEKVAVQGDFRFRYENIDQEDAQNRNRDRIRARAAIVATPVDKVEVGFGLSTRQDGDPVASNQTLGDGGSGKDIYLDLAYFNWSALEGTNLMGGKFRNNLYRPGRQGLIWDGDFNPEGFGLTYTNGLFFGNGLFTWLESDSNNTQAYGAGGQVGVTWPVTDTVTLTAGGGYFYLNTQGKGAFWVAPGGTPDYYGNSVDANGQYLYDYDEVEAFADLGLRAFGLPLSFFFDYVTNRDAGKYDTGWAAGAQLGVAKARGTWEIVYNYQDLQADAVFGLWTDSDFGGGGTDTRGHVIRGAYALSDKTNLAFSYFINQFGMNAGDGLDYNRLQLDMNFRY